MSKARATLDTLRLDILSSALTALTEEIEITLLRSAYSQVVKEAQDASCAIFTAEGRIVAQPVVIPGHLGSMKYMLAACLEAYPAATLAPGDVLITNDPYQGGSHLPDIALYRPIFLDGALIAFTGCIIHYTDVGGMVPGSNPQRATELYQEGIVLPPMKLAEGGRPNDTLRKLIAANVRNPDIFFGDLHAQEAALATGERRVLALVERFGIEPIRAAMATLIALTEDKARAEIAAMQRGSYVFEDFMDHDGIDLDRPVGIRVRLDVLPDRLRFDFTGTDPQVKGPLNAPLSKTWTTVFYCVMCALSDDVHVQRRARQGDRGPRARGHGAQSAPPGAGQCALGDGQPRRRRGAGRARLRGAGASRRPILRRADRRLVRRRRSATPGAISCSTKAIAAAWARPWTATARTRSAPARRTR